MIDKETIHKIINERKTFTIDTTNNMSIMDNYWKKLTSEFLKADNEDEIIEFLYTLNDEDLMYASEVFSDINYAIDDDYFEEKIEQLQKDRCI